MQAAEVILFWRDAGPKRWFGKNEAFDDMCEIGFEDTCDKAARGELDQWMQSADGALALMILLDQMPRNIHRGTPEAYAGDAHARKLAELAIGEGFDQQVDPSLRQFFYTPFMHSESMDDQNRAVELYQGLPGEDADKWAVHHRRIIEQFGRFPHRNAILGRDSTAEEQAWLEQDGFKG
ncbi:MAG: DUF924 family protein [Rhodanobacteraceae bacterium]